MNIYIGEPVEVSDMQGPCPDGFHVPTETEWTNIINAGVTLGAWTSGTPLDLSIKLKIPLAGGRYTNDGSTIGQSTNGYCRTCKFLMSNGYPTAYELSINSIYYEVTYTGITTGRSIRPFKNTAVQPDSSWTTIYQGTGSAGIFHNATLGLISISSDGTTWYTIADKNLGATAVWNSGDTLSEANCGKYYQRGNNYGFPRTGSVTTSTTKVSAADYGPGNYYSSNTFICVTARPYNRDSSNNQNLRGGVSQGTSTKSVEVQNIYIGEYGWKPGENTIAYYPLTSTSTVNDMSGNSRNLTNNGTLFGTYAGVSCAYFDTTDAKKLYGTLPLSGNTVFTINVWVYRLSNASGINPNIFTLGDTGTAGRCFGVGYTNNNNYYLFYTWGTDRTSTTLCTKDAWDMLTITNDGTKITMYKNNTQFLQYSVTLNVNTTNFTIGSFPYLTDNKWYIYNGYMSNFIVENKVRTAQEISDYYNQTKGNYGL